MGGGSRSLGSESMKLWNADNSSSRSSKVTCCASRMRRRSCESSAETSSLIAEASRGAASAGTRSSPTSRCCHLLSCLSIGAKLCADDSLIQPNVADQPRGGPFAASAGTARFGAARLQSLLEVNRSISFSGGTRRAPIDAKDLCRSRVDFRAKGTGSSVQK